MPAVHTTRHNTHTSATFGTARCAPSSPSSHGLRPVLSVIHNNNSNVSSFAEAKPTTPTDQRPLMFEDNSPYYANEADHCHYHDEQQFQANLAYHHHHAGPHAYVDDSFLQHHQPSQQQQQQSYDHHEAAQYAPVPMAADYGFGFALEESDVAAAEPYLNHRQSIYDAPIRFADSCTPSYVPDWVAGYRRSLPLAVPVESPCSNATPEEDMAFPEPDVAMSSTDDDDDEEVQPPASYANIAAALRTTHGDALPTPRRRPQQRTTVTLTGTPSPHAAIAAPPDAPVNVSVASSAGVSGATTPRHPRSHPRLRASPPVTPQNEFYRSHGVCRGGAAHDDSVSSVEPSEPSTRPTPVGRRVVACPADAMRTAAVKFRYRSEHFAIAPAVMRTCPIGTVVIVEGDRGAEAGVIAEITEPMPGNEPPTNAVLRCASAAEVAQRRAVDAEAENAVASVQRLVDEMAADNDNFKSMTVVDCEFQLDRNKLYVHYTSPFRVTFKSFTRRLFETYRCRVWMNQLNYTNLPRKHHGGAPNATSSNNNSNSNTRTSKNHTNGNNNNRNRK